MKDLNYYLVPAYTLIAIIIIASQVYSYASNKYEQEMSLKMAEEGYEQVVEKLNGYSPILIWKKAALKAEK